MTQIKQSVNHLDFKVIFYPLFPPFFLCPLIFFGWSYTLSLKFSNIWGDIVEELMQTLELRGIIQELDFISKS